MMLTARRQRDDRSRDWGVSRALGLSATRYDHSPADRQACNGRQDLQARRCLTHVSPCITGGGFGPRPFPIHVARASLSVEPRRRVQGFSSPLARGSVATPIEFVRAVMAARRQLGFPQHFVRQDLDVLEAHVERLSCAVGFNNRDHDTCKGPKSWKPQPTRTAP
jgi:hypothetical protein